MRLVLGKSLISMPQRAAI